MKHATCAAERPLRAAPALVADDGGALVVRSDHMLAYGRHGCVEEALLVAEHGPEQAREHRPQAAGREQQERAVSAGAAGAALLTGKHSAATCAMLPLASLCSASTVPSALNTEA